MTKGAQVLTLQDLSEEMLAPELGVDTKGYFYILRMSEARARAFFEQVRWPRGVVCVRCRSKDVVYANSVSDGLHDCMRCRSRFVVTTGTPVGRVPVSCKTWLEAVFLLCCTNRRLKILDLSRILGVGYHQARRITQEVGMATGWTRSRAHIMFYSLEAAVLRLMRP